MGIRTLGNLEKIPLVLAALRMFAFNMPYHQRICCVLPNASLGEIYSFPKITPKKIKIKNQKIECIPIVFAKWLK